MSITCEPLLAALKECLLRSDCVVKQGRLPSECLREHVDELPEECQSLRKATFECKRSLLDMRKRFRGTNAGMMAQKIKGEGTGAETTSLASAPPPAETSDSTV